jgi:HAD superfamily hydrolase (TIGR01509 family)
VYRAILFDMDGVVVDTERSVAEFWQDLAQDVGRGELGADDLERDVYGRSAEHTLRSLFPQIAESQYDDVMLRMRENNERLRYPAIPGVTELLSQLHDCAIPLALVTGAQHWKATEVLRQLDLTETFQVRVQAEDVSAGKPDPSCYMLAAQRLAAPIARCLVFEDAVTGVTSAVSAGACCVAVTPARRKDRVRAAGATAVVRDFRDVAFSPRDRALRVGAKISFSFAAGSGDRSLSTHS